MLVQIRLVEQDDVVARAAGPEDARVRLEVEVLVVRVRDLLVDQQPGGAVPGVVALALARGREGEKVDGVRDNHEVHCGNDGEVGRTRLGRTGHGACQVRGVNVSLDFHLELQ